MLILLGLFLFYLATFYALLGTVAETCTMGVADSLLGGVFAAALYLPALAILIAHPPRPPGWILLVPGVLGAAYLVVWSVRFFVAYHLHAVSACDLITGDPGYGFDGREPFLTAWWLGMSLIVAGGLAWSGVRMWRTATGRSAATRDPAGAGR